MPLSTIKCTRCGLAFASEGYVYATDADGNRICCAHPGEVAKIKEITGMEWLEARAAGRAGHMTACLCFQCVEQFDLDLEHDEKKCPKCGSDDVHTAEDAIGRKCPKCGDGMFREFREQAKRRVPRKGAKPPRRKAP